MARGAWLAGLGLALAGCFQDFEGFAFREDAEADRVDAASLEEPGEAAVASDSPMDAAMAEAPNVEDASAPIAPASDAAAASDAAMTPADGGTTTTTDAGAPDADTGLLPPATPAQVEACGSSLSALTPALAADCLDCGCGECALAVLDCVDSGDSEASAACGAVLRCALEQGCQDWDCYCTSPPCGAPGSDGDGPCVAEINAAVGGAGGRMMVDAVRASGDPRLPLNRAARAIECTLGLHPRAVGGPVDGLCEGACAP
ncbi:MAG: hypothetical protein OEZ06_26715 [Myxococcales bacterium]|nr:hypothetical protein [Myxococcales bacterium]